MKNLFLLLLIFCLVLPLKSETLAAERGDYEKNLKNWQENKVLASKYLKKAESALKRGDRGIACKNQKKASFYGIKSTKSLIKAYEAADIEIELKELTNNLYMWNTMAKACK